MGLTPQHGPVQTCYLGDPTNPLPPTSSNLFTLGFPPTYWQAGGWSSIENPSCFKLISVNYTLCEELQRHAATSLYG